MLNLALSALVHFSCASVRFSGQHVLAHNATLQAEHPASVSLVMANDGDEKTMTGFLDVFPETTNVLLADAGDAKRIELTGVHMNSAWLNHGSGMWAEKIFKKADYTTDRVNWIVCVDDGWTKGIEIAVFIEQTETTSHAYMSVVPGTASYCKGVCDCAATWPLTELVGTSTSVSMGGYGVDEVKLTIRAEDNTCKAHGSATACNAAPNCFWAADGCRYDGCGERGPPGEKGPTGYQGDKGVPGDKGATGETGPGLATVVADINTLKSLRTEVQDLTTKVEKLEAENKKMAENTARLSALEAKMESLTFPDATCASNVVDLNLGAPGQVWIQDSFPNKYWNDWGFDVCNPGSDVHVLYAKKYEYFCWLMHNPMSSPKNMASSIQVLFYIVYHYLAVAA